MNIVTGFVSGINRRGDRDLSKYIAFGLELMAVEIPITVFIEHSVFEEYVRHKLHIPVDNAIQTFFYQPLDNQQEPQYYSYLVAGHIRFVFFEKTDLFLWQHKSLATAFSLNTGNPTKDTLEYMMVQCQKSEWLVIAEALSRQCEFEGIGKKEYVWIDFGVFHMFKGKIDAFQIELYKMRNRVNRRVLQYGESTRVLFARCWDPNHSFFGDIYRDVNWTFAGSVFGGGSAAVLRFAKLMRDKCFCILNERNTLMWEINIWLLIYREHPDLFGMYPSDHSEIIFLHYA